MKLVRQEDQRIQIFPTIFPYFAPTNEFHAVCFGKSRGQQKWLGETMTYPSKNGALSWSLYFFAGGYNFLWLKGELLLRGAWPRKRLEQSMYASQIGQTHRTPLQKKSQMTYLNPGILLKGSIRRIPLEVSKIISRISGSYHSWLVGDFLLLVPFRGRNKGERMQ